jgi:hypothetical protein
MISVLLDAVVDSRRFHQQQAFPVTETAGRIAPGARDLPTL